MAVLLTITFYKLNNYLQADTGNALKPFLYKLAKRYHQYYDEIFNHNIPIDNFNL